MNDEKRSALAQLPSKSSFRIILLIGTLIIFILLAGSLSNLNFRSGNPIPARSRPEAHNQPLPSNDQIYDTPTPLLAGTIGILFLIFMVYVGFELIKATNLKIILRLLLGLAVLLAFLYAIPKIDYQTTTAPPEVNPQNIIKATESAPPEVSSPGQPPQEFVLLVLMAAGLGFFLVVYLTILKMKETDPIQNQLLAEANAAVKGLRSGQSYRNVIINCYERMSQALIDHKGIQRDFAMTAREFEEWLEDLGYPPKPIHQLTVLFEEVRYGGNSQAAPNDEAAAIDCLDQIIQHCKLEAGT